ncbi:phosphoesterase family-domain-containing protein [Phascolomyces articulosus]|uniref:Phosphoesterase family-domain-containing protein n=1 Tax=Phascolomyces articulosus TaxID=60185 RepID=A0AAD5PMQ6_9FUNG|nr:phosphoesterase family-domain-containing protein [Phascolomyces articulosus]
MRFWKFLVASLIAGVGAAQQISGKDYDRIVIIVMENQDYQDCLDDSYFSNIARDHNGIVLTNFFALTHPSQPNYVGLISGSYDGINADSDSNVSRKSVVDLLEAKGISWKVYQESYPGGCYTGTKSGTYRRKHNPFISFTNISGNSTRCANIVPATQLDTDIDNNAVPQFVFYTPDMNNDGHDTSLKYSSDWLKSWLEPRVTKSAFNTNTLFILTWDENKTYAIPNQILTVLFGPAVDRVDATDNTKYDLYSILKSIEQNWGLGNLGQGDVNATPLVVKD